MGLLDTFTTLGTAPSVVGGVASTSGKSSSQKDAADEDYIPPVPVVTPMRRSMHLGALEPASAGGITPLLFSMTSNRSKRSAFSTFGEDSEQARKKLKEHVEKVSDFPEFDAEDRQEIIDVAELSLHETVLSLYVKMMLLTKRFNAQQEKELLAFITGKDFKAKLRIHITACLLAPDISGYLGGTVEAIMSLIQSNPDLFGVPRELLQYHPHLLPQLRKQVVEDLSASRGAIRTKIIASLEEKDGSKGLPMNELAKNLASGIVTMEVQTKHWARFSFLRSCQVKFAAHLEQNKLADSSASSESDFNESLSDIASTTPSAAATGADNSSTVPKAVKSRYSPNKYWNYVDDHLADLRDEAAKLGKNKQGQEAILGRFFQEALAADLKKYKAPNNKAIKPPPVKPILNWQQKFTDAMVF
ncbi:hypothetical protein V5O48_013000 [Marasmius crinis-equi]|uniref:Uncharacterized protein n=1 Tax=Marasmius crinis-equi TaxID=585013 RepID=A0ABR3F190_9AGAR